jgi:FdhD protein
MSWLWVTAWPKRKYRLGRKRAGVCLHDGAAWVTTETGTARAVEKPPFVPITAEKLCSYGGLLDSLSTAHHASHGVHEGALVQGDEVLVYTEDIGRHNVLDRLRGFVELQHIDVSQAVLVFSGRVPQSVIEKVHGLGVRFLASRALPTSLGVSLAEQYQITLACGLRPDSFKIFAHPERVLL